MKEIITMVKGYVDDLAHLLMSFVAIGAVSEVIFGTGIFGVNVIGNLTSIINKFGESGYDIGHIKGKCKNFPFLFIRDEILQCNLN